MTRAWGSQSLLEALPFSKVCPSVYVHNVYLKGQHGSPRFLINHLMSDINCPNIIRNVLYQYREGMELLLNIFWYYLSVKLYEWMSMMDVLPGICYSFIIINQIHLNYFLFVVIINGCRCLSFTLSPHHCQYALLQSSSSHPFKQQCNYIYNISISQIYFKGTLI